MAGIFNFSKSFTFIYCQGGGGGHLHIRPFLLSSSSTFKLTLVLLPEAVSGREEVPAPPLVHVPDVGLLTRVLGVVLVDEVHQEEPEIITCHKKPRN